MPLEFADHLAGFDAAQRHCITVESKGDLLPVRAEYGEIHMIEPTFKTADFFTRFDIPDLYNITIAITGSRSNLLPVGTESNRVCNISGIKFANLLSG